MQGYARFRARRIKKLSARSAQSPCARSLGRPLDDPQLTLRRPSTHGRLSDDPRTARATAVRRPPAQNFLKKTKCVSNDRSRHDDQFCPRIVKIGAILGYFWPFQSLRKTPTQDLHARSHKTFHERPRPVNFFYKIL